MPIPVCQSAHDVDKRDRDVHRDKFTRALKDLVPGRAGNQHLNDAFSSKTLFLDLSSNLKGLRGIREGLMRLIFD
jgi:hypothetical protein